MYDKVNNSTVPELLCDECGNPVGHQYYVIPEGPNVFRYLCPTCDRVRNSHAEVARQATALRMFQEETKEKLKEIKDKFIPACEGYNLERREVEWLMKTVEHLLIQSKNKEL